MQKGWVNTLFSYTISVCLMVSSSITSDILLLVILLLIENFYAFLIWKLCILLRLGRMFLYILEGYVLFVLLSFESSFLCQYLWFVSASCMVRLVCCCLFLVFSFHCFLVLFSFLDIFALFRSFLISPFGLISHPGFISMFEFHRGIPILSLTSFSTT